MLVESHSPMDGSRFGNPVTPLVEGFDRRPRSPAVTSRGLSRFIGSAGPSPVGELGELATDAGG